MKKCKFGVKGMMCTACVAHVERAAKSVTDGEITVSLLTNSLIVAVDDSENEEALKKRLSKAVKKAGYALVDANKELDEKKEYKKSRARLLASIVLCLALMYVSMGAMMGIPQPAILENTGVFKLFRRHDPLAGPRLLHLSRFKIRPG